MKCEDPIQIQVQIGETRRVFFMPSPRTYNDLTEAIRREIPKTRGLTFGLLYENDEKELVVMNNDPPLSYNIPWRSGSYTCFSNRSEAKNMADFGLY